MQMNPTTKDVFREMDGFLILMNTLSTGAFSPSENPAEADEKVIKAFAAATIDHPTNLWHFKVRLHFNRVSRRLTSV
jgi:hypothetical protein